MALANNAPVNTRAIIDINYVGTANLPAGAANTNTNALDMIQAKPYPTTEYVLCQVLMAAAATSTNNKNINVTLEDSANNVTFAIIPIFASPLLQVTDNNGAGWAAQSVQVMLPPTVRRYIRAKATGEANGNPAAGVVLTCQLQF
jgi:hypothetical protein